MDRHHMGPSPDEWQRHRGEIIQLYTLQNWSLLRVKEYMQGKHGFRATDKMYKTRLHQWGISKKMTRSRAKAHLILLRTNSHRGTSRDQELELRRVLSYLARLPHQDRDDILHEVTNCVQTAPFIQGPLSDPQDLGTVYECVHLLEEYVQCSNERQEWARDSVDGYKRENVVPTWCSSLLSAQYVLREGKTREATTLISHFLSQCPSQLQRRDPLFFSIYYGSILLFADTHVGVAGMILKSMHEISDTLAWSIPSHPLRRLLHVLCRLGPTLMHAHASQILCAYIDAVQDSLGAAYPIVQDIMSDAMTRLLYNGQVSPEGVTDMGHRIEAAAVGKNLHRNACYLNMQVAQANSYMNSGRYQEAYDKAIGTLGDEYAEFRNDEIRLGVYMLLGAVRLCEKRFDEAIEFARLAVTESVVQFGEGSDWNLNAMINHRRVLEKAGRVREAETLSYRRDETLTETLKKLEV